jgi:hypothetical protein
VLSYSSIAPRHTTDTLNNLLRSNKVAWTGSETGFIFAQNDDAQKIVVDLGQLRAISSIGVHLNPSGTSRGVWDFIRIRVSVDKSSWRDWKMIGKDDSKVDIKNYIYEVRLNNYEVGSSVSKPGSDPIYFRFPSPMRVTSDILKSPSVLPFELPAWVRVLWRSLRLAVSTKLKLH